MFKTLTIGAALAALFLLFSPVGASAQEAGERQFTQNVIDPPVCSTEIYNNATSNITKIASYDGEVNAESVRAIIEAKVGPGGFNYKWSRVEFFSTEGTDRSLMTVFTDDPTGVPCVVYSNDMLTVNEVDQIGRAMTFKQIGEIIEGNGG